MGEGTLARNAGYVVIGSGGGGAGGNYVFADLDELDAIIDEWTAIRDGVQADGRKLLQAQQLIVAPAKDLMSQLQPAAMNESLTKAIGHNAAMADYADGYVQKLQAARAQYGADDEQAAARMRSVDGG
ncbi:MAG: hypothetical protein GEV28_15960 [Actinophytocola sp.]|uniref:hypothetical protein n=1 Tax=Actinophytocola sp. TaxID=1872138 RepID=UPI001323D807|nr:hypothetical protein [Actinophytocola sp.]MPZ81805.1 hypothetical protein [Actinophytocola sp.]